MKYQPYSCTNVNVAFHVPKKSSRYRVLFWIIWRFSSQDSGHSETRLKCKYFRRWPLKVISNGFYNTVQSFVSYFLILFNSAWTCCSVSGVTGSLPEKWECISPEKQDFFFQFHNKPSMGRFQCIQAILSLVEQLAIHTLHLILSYEYMVLPSPSYIFPYHNV